MAYTDELDNVAEWFENSGMGKLTVKQIAAIIRKWRPGRYDVGEVGECEWKDCHKPRRCFHYCHEHHELICLEA